MKNKRDYTLILASASPRRKELLESIGLNLKIVKADIYEELESTNATKEALRLSLLKAKKIEEIEKKRWILAADTLVFKGKQIFGKPTNRKDAKRILKTLSNSTHKVVTAVTIISPDANIHTFHSITKVKFIDITDEILDKYIQTDEWKDAAGGYKIQEQGKMLVSQIKGSLTNVVGLPLEKCLKYL